MPGYRVLRYDVRGYGKSSRPETGATYSHVRDLEVLLEANEVALTALIGCSMGGGIGLDYVLVHPEQVWALVPVATGLGGFEATEEEDEWWAERDGPIEAAIEAGDLERAQDLRLEDLGAPRDVGRGRRTGSARSPSTTCTRS